MLLELRSEELAEMIHHSEIRSRSVALTGPAAQLRRNDLSMFGGVSIGRGPMVRKDVAGRRTVMGRGAETIEAPQDRPWGVRAAYRKGPGGLTVEIEQLLKRT